MRNNYKVTLNIEKGKMETRVKEEIIYRLIKDTEATYLSYYANLEINHI